jgi:chromosomal replication initiator protein
MYILKEDLKATLVDIGNLLGGRDHTTIMHGVSKIRTLIEEDPILRDELKQIKDVLEAGE